MPRVLVLGARGLLGSAVYRKLTDDKSLETIGTSSKAENLLVKFNVFEDDLYEVLKSIGPTHIVNCVGKIPQKNLHPRVLNRSQAMFRLNTFFPQKVSRWAVKNGVTVIQIQTDCVFRGTRGNYDEDSIKYPSDLYSLSKILGEFKGNSQVNIRTSIVGNSAEDSSSLFGWFRNLPRNSKVNGFVNHLWNGTTTNVFAKLIEGLINSGNDKPLNAHLVPRNSLSKFEMLEIFKEILDRSDISITPITSPKPIDRRLSTNNQKLNEALWSLAGYKSIPDIRDLLRQTLK
jgi:dTDP-4-dehydrorhamnose reductase